MDSFLHNHQSALDSQREDDAIQNLQDSGIYPDPGDYPDNDAIMEALYEDIRNEYGICGSDFVGVFLVFYK